MGGCRAEGSWELTRQELGGLHRCLWDGNGFFSLAFVFLL